MEYACIEISNISIKNKRAGETAQQLVCYVLAEVMSLVLNIQVRTSIQCSFLDLVGTHIPEHIPLHRDIDIYMCA